MQKITFADLCRLLARSAGEIDGVELVESMIDDDFGEMGYDSLALMETAAAITKEYGVVVPDEALGEVRTPRQFLELVDSARAAS